MNAGKNERVNEWLEQSTNELKEISIKQSNS